VIVSVEGKTAVVTAAGRDLGRTVADELAAARVARSEDELAETARQVKHLGAAAVVVPADLADLSQRTRDIHLATDELGAVDITVRRAFGRSCSVHSAESADEVRPALRRTDGRRAARSSSPGLAAARMPARRLVESVA
jgi:short-subunit dehydrogenase